jgi:hypothetical protein
MVGQFWLVCPLCGLFELAGADLRGSPSPCRSGFRRPGVSSRTCANTSYLPGPATGEILVVAAAAPMSASARRGRISLTSRFLVTIWTRSFSDLPGVLWSGPHVARGPAPVVGPLARRAPAFKRLLTAVRFPRPGRGPFVSSW